MKNFACLLAASLLACVLTPWGLVAQTTVNGSLQFGAPASRLVIKATSLPVPWTAEMWVRRRDGAGLSAPLFIGPVGALKLEQFDSGRKVGLTIFADSDPSFDYQAPAGQWVHLAFVATADGTALFVNGAYVDSIWETLALPLDYFG